MTHENTMPRFRTQKFGKRVKVFLQCSEPECEKDLRELKDNDEIDIRRAYFCKAHDKGVIALNVGE